ncbi:type IV pilin protein [Thiolapillus sp.]
MIATNRKHGFTLIELMIVVAVVGILAAIAYPSYVDSVRKARRSDGTAALMNAAQKMEAYYARNAAYTGATLANTNIPATSEESYYNITINSANASSYTLRATAAGDQANDQIKGFQLTSTGAKTHTLDSTNWTTVGWDD